MGNTEGNKKAILYSRLWMLFILLGAAMLRLYGLNNLSPPGLAHDEVANWLIDRSILDAGNHAIYFTRAYGHEAGFHYLQAAFVALIGDHALALRLPAAFAGLLGVAITYALSRRLFGPQVALFAAGLLAALFWPVFYSRLALRAILLPLFSGLSAYFWWRGWGRRHPLSDDLRSPSPATTGRSQWRSQGAFTLSFLLAGLFAGLSLHTYMAARVVPIFYGLFIIYLLLFHRDRFKQCWPQIVYFVIIFAVVSAPLFIFLQTNPGAEFRISEIDAPLQALRVGELQPVLKNGLQILGMFGFVGDPLWRQGVPTQPVFEPVSAVLFYAGLLLVLWRWRDERMAFLLFWLGTAVLPSLVTINAPSTIRIINALPVLTIFPALVIHNSTRLSTVFRRLSTEFRQSMTIFSLTIFLFYALRTSVLVFHTWPGGGDVPFVWQAAFTETAVYLDNHPDIEQIALGGWSPDTIDAPTMALTMRHDDARLSHFNPAAGTLIIPASSDNTATIIRPSALDLDPLWETQLAAWDAVIETQGHITLYTLPDTPVIQPQYPVQVTFGDELRFLGYDVSASDRLVTYWQVIRPSNTPRRLFVHWLDEAGNVLADDYRLDTLDPQSLWFPHWQSADFILQRHGISLEAGAATHIRVGWFDPYSCHPGPCQNLETDKETDHVLITLERE